MQASIRESIIGAVDADYVAAYPGIPIVYDNTPFDRNSPPAAWVEFEIKFMDGNQIGMAAQPKTRISGFVYITVWSRSGAGSKSNLLILDWFFTKLKYLSVGGVNLQEPKPAGSGTPVGLYWEQLKLYFYSDPT